MCGSGHERRAYISFACSMETLLYGTGNPSDLIIRDDGICVKGDIQLSFRFDRIFCKNWDSEFMNENCDARSGSNALTRNNQWIVVLLWEVCQWKRLILLYSRARITYYTITVILIRKCRTVMLAKKLQETIKRLFILTANMTHRNYSLFLSYIYTREYILMSFLPHVCVKYTIIELIVLPIYITYIFALSRKQTSANHYFKTPRCLHESLGPHQRKAMANKSR